MNLKVLLLIFAFSSCFSCQKSPIVDMRQHFPLEVWKENTLNSSALASLTASARMAFTSNGVNDVPPPRGKSTSVVNSEDFAGWDSSVLWDSVLDFFTLCVDEASSSVRFWAAIMSLKESLRRTRQKKA